jgi:hypothetical protein
MEKHKEALDCYTNILIYKDNFGTVRTAQGIPKPVSVRQVSVMQFKKCIRKRFQVYAFQVTNLLEKEYKTKSARVSPYLKTTLLNKSTKTDRIKMQL